MSENLKVAIIGAGMNKVLEKNPLSEASNKKYKSACNKEYQNLAGIRHPCCN